MEGTGTAGRERVIARCVRVDTAIIAVSNQFCCCRCALFLDNYLPRAAVLPPLYLDAGEFVDSRKLIAHMF